MKSSWLARVRTPFRKVAASGHEHQGDSNPSEHRALTILLAEDDPINQQVVREILNHSRYQLEIVSDGAEALTLLRSGKQIDLVILDIRMPQVSGIEVLKQLRLMASRALLPVLMLTSEALPSTISECMQAGASDYLIKPVDGALLLEKIREHTAQPGDDESAVLDSEAVTEQDEVLDASVINSLCRLITQPEKRQKLFDAFQSTGSEHLVRLREAAEQGDRHSYLIRVHSIKGPAATLGVSGVVSRCREIEAVDENLSSADMLRFCAELELAFGRAIEALKFHLLLS
ncbi:response regulator [Mariprofundus sp. KV]|uniref:Hpt domain-containing response regulator n=1 Tax=Mariprofundus sp. KV TaxID=2608715 RepID=UPI0015A2AB96|nr:response regulator [Mariprofundus sp. KV]NWF35444.1 response regulator [Mariprofundus sp. KV]